MPEKTGHAPDPEDPKAKLDGLLTACDLCGAVPWRVHNDRFALVAINDAGEVQGHGVSVVVSECDRCGYIRLFNRNAL